ncbi:hypothetical protein CLAFUW4_05458 [Fulvia fulva]|uniref:Uncharacterized protein n=1 Tax=Passalora fulva TaxID=5499 RepID=A0A9Q8LIV4_PASFU|nr:uncharacterized protein CLAFUR5_05601 [Fulvia fulva]KAK4624754.1 hypothetical protein CLAFUR4_05452 [Fulvia fulva]KAK4625151.1 hypothetical protein CLAFUR0_05460 [Fulvia fulva]UJO18190.1 hypothetical protein CLAFUR5_05601 [Fulvia fulva]WPV15221.1 hypothetical protein CLAFUW4_05458 [Fulvia fulva]WPV30403.1 hypothetical protein CLAFUW7_05456 [Fulvia fulva]
MQVKDISAVKHGTSLVPEFSRTKDWQWGNPSSSKLFEQGHYASRTWRRDQQTADHLLGYSEGTESTSAALDHDRIAVPYGAGIM